MQVPINPYRTGEPVGHTDDFVGRDDIVARVKEVLEDPHRNAILLYGQRRVGKTSVLQFLEKQLADEDRYYPVYFDLHGKSGLPLGQILRELAYTVTQKLQAFDSPNLIWKPEEAFRERWLRDVQARLSGKSSLVLLFDELDVLADPNSRFSPDPQQLSSLDLFRYLKDLSREYLQVLQFVFVIGRHKEDLSIVAQSLFRESPQCLVSLLYQRDVIDLVKLSEKNETLYWNESAIGQVIRLTNGHPLLTQQLCSRVWELAHAQSSRSTLAVTSEDVVKVIPGVLQDAGKDLRWLWQSLSGSERVAAAVLAEAGPDPVGLEELENLLQSKSQLRIVIREVREAPRLLRDHDVLEFVDQDMFRFRVELVRRWIAQNKPPEVVQMEVDGIQSIAENLYQAALRLYQKGKLEQAIGTARQAFSNNRYHIGVNQLLADILLAQNQVNEARELLEQLYEHQPTAASARLIDVYLNQAEEAKGDDRRLELYKRILEISPSHQETLKKWKGIWEFKAEYAAQLAKSTDKIEHLEAAYEAYDKAGLREEAERIERRIKRRVITVGQQELDQMEQAGQYSRALALLDDLESRFPTSLWEEYRLRLTPNAELEGCYEDAIEALARGEDERAQALFIQVVKNNPQYKDVTRYLHWAVTGSGFSEESSSRYEGVESRVQQARDEATRAKSESARLQEELVQARAKIPQLTRKLKEMKERAQREVDRRGQCECEMESQKSHIASLQRELREQKREFDLALEESEMNAREQIQRLDTKWCEKVHELHKERESISAELDEYRRQNKKLERELDRSRRQNAAMARQVAAKARNIENMQRKTRRCLILVIVVSVLFLLNMIYSLLLG